MAATAPPLSRSTSPPTPWHRQLYFWVLLALYFWVLLAVALGILVSALRPSTGLVLKPVGAGFVSLIRMMIPPIIFCTIVLGVGSVRKAAEVGAVGGFALGCFLAMPTVALALGLLVGNLLEPGPVTS